jgi:hypothetical protein
MLNLTSKKGRLWLVLVLLVLIGAGVGLYLKIHKSQTVKLAIDHIYSQQDQYNDYQLPNAATGAGVGFKKPSGFTQTSAASKDGQVTATVTGFETASSSSSLPSTHAYINVLSSADPLAQPGYQFSSDVLKKRLQADLPGNANIKLDSVKPLVTTNLKTDAWQVDFTSSVTPPKSKTALVMPGKLIFVVGNHTFYYFTIVASNQYNWDNNQTTWARIVDSIKVDQ